MISLYDNSFFYNRPYSAKEENYYEYDYQNMASHEEDLELLMLIQHQESRIADAYGDDEKLRKEILKRDLLINGGKNAKAYFGCIR